MAKNKKRQKNAGQNQVNNQAANSQNDAEFAEENAAGGQAEKHREIRNARKQNRNNP